MDMNADSTISISKHAVYQEVASETVILNLDTEQYYGLDEVGSQAWKALQEVERIGDVAQRLEREYEVERERLLADLINLFEELRKAGLVNVQPLIDKD